MKNLKNSDVSFQSCVNEGNVTGRGDFISGFIGQVDNCADTHIIINTCANNGNVSGSSSTSGFIGYFKESPNIVVEITNSSNSGTIRSSTRTGGFIGYAQTRGKATFFFQDCINYGVVDGSSPAGGFFGWLNCNSLVNLTVYRSANVGLVLGSANVGGIVGKYVNYYPSSSVSLSCVSNIGLVNGTKNVGGFIGVAEIVNTTSLYFVSCSNNGTIQAPQGNACGFYCCDYSGSLLSANVHNSASKGQVLGQDAYGIARTITTVKNVVSMATVVGTQSTIPLFIGVTSVDSLYALESVCKGCESKILFKYDTVDSEYKVVSTGESVQQKMTNKSLEAQYEMVWDRNLDLEAALQVFVGNPFNKYVYLLQSDTYASVAHYLGFSWSDFVFINITDWTPISHSSPIENGSRIVLCHHLNTYGSVNASVLVEHSTFLSDIAILKPYTNHRYLITDINNKSQVFEGSSQITKNMDIIITVVSRVVIELEPTDADNVTSSDIMETITDLIGLDPDVLIEIVQNDDGEVTTIIVIVKDEQIAHEIVGVINGLENGNGCTAGVLCRKTNAFIYGEELSFSNAFLHLPHSLFLCFVIFIISLF